MILADTSAWVEYDRATGSAVHRRVRELIASEGPLSVTEPIIMEVLAGARSDERKLDLRRLLLRFTLLRFDAVADFDAAARIYRRCRVLRHWRGVPEAPAAVWSGPPSMVGSSTVWPSRVMTAAMWRART
jgi:predicted nucleic acid-binding protein